MNRFTVDRGVQVFLELFCFKDPDKYCFLSCVFSQTIALETDTSYGYGYLLIHNKKHILFQQCKNKLNYKEH